MRFIGKLLPVDGYYVLLNGDLPVDYMKSLTHLYQPLLGLKAISLYTTLLNDIELQTSSSLQNHHTLVNYLSISLEDIYEARLKLEGIGLLQTYENTEEEQKSYMYALQSPFSPEDFFDDAMLAELLYYHLGNKKYHTLKKHFKTQVAFSAKKNITATFGDVFQTFQPTFQEDIKLTKDVVKQQGPNIELTDFSNLNLMLKQRMISAKKVLTPSNRRLISEMMFLYNLATYEIEKSVLWALTEENLLDVEEFKQACHDLFKMNHHGKPIQLEQKLTEAKPEPVPKEAMTREEQLIQQFETISPKQLLEDLSSGNQASEREMRMIQEIMTRQGLPAPVMNVLVHYVLIQSNMKLSRNYLDAIATHWSRANLKTARQAMDFAKQQIEEFQKNQAEKQQSTEVIPDWFKDRKKQSNQDKTTTEKESNQDLDREREEAELAALLQELSGNE